MNKDPLVNGTIGYVKDIYESFVKLPPFLTKGRLERLDYYAINFDNEDGDSYGFLSMDKQLFLTGEPALTDYENCTLSRYKPLGYFRLDNFTYGYAVTGHKAQGSEWNKVLVIEENFPFNKEEHMRWLYTCCTRSSQKLVLVKAD